MRRVRNTRADPERSMGRELDDDELPRYPRVTALELVVGCNFPSHTLQNEAPRVNMPSGWVVDEAVWARDH